MNQIIKNKYVKNKKELGNLVEMYKKQGMKVVLTNGCFDIIHAGHIEYLQKARELGDVFIVGINTDSSVKKIKGEKRPINTLKDRMAVLGGLAAVDHLIAFNEDRPANLILSAKPDIYVKGGDYKPERLRSTVIVEKLGGKVVIIPFKKGKSTTEIINRILEVYQPASRN
ncbi:D-glycero-beta-D-manno-heptose 1-phosphate adenylyltransferase [Candidatus Parcubacteria bacterium]|nr:MAG: D-glycero-beta-D-manno-heptose 1-phosphate adenylyltransferase [Candidatus Parcubacteria bacterium]